MLKILSVPTALSVLMISGTAYAEYDTSYQLDALAKSRWSIFDNPDINFAVIFVVVLFAVIKVLSGGNRRSGGSDSSTDTAEHYDQEAHRFRALTRKLDAETVASDSLMRTLLKGDELKEIKKLIDGDK